jgi:hypothetical protein
VDLNNAPEAERLRNLWSSRQAAEWPDSVERGGDEDWDQAGVEPVMLDADIAGVVCTVLGSRRPPDAGQQAILASCLEDLERVWPKMPPDAKPYFQRLRDMADLALRTAGRRA